MDLGLQGKRALVTGRSAGIGAEIAEALAAEGVSAWSTVATPTERRPSPSEYPSETATRRWRWAT